jgi:hypothetical protein
MWFLLGGIFGAVAMYARVKAKQAEALQNAIERYTKSLLKEFEKNGN